MLRTGEKNLFFKEELTNEKLLALKIYVQVTLYTLSRL